MVKRRNRKLQTQPDLGLSSVDKGVQYYRTTLSNSLGYTDGFASSIWPMGGGHRLNGSVPGVEPNGIWHNTGSSEGWDFGDKILQWLGSMKFCIIPLLHLLPVV